jgi:hypothetical protein
MSQAKKMETFAFDQPGNYRIRVLGLLDKSWSERLGGVRISQREHEDQERPVTELIGKMRDQAELSGLLNTLYELHLTLLSVKYLGSG